MFAKLKTLTLRALSVETMSFTSMTWGQIVWQLTYRGARIWVVVFAIMYVLQRQFIYAPFGGEADPKVLGFPGFQAARLERGNGISNVVWTTPAAPAKPTILYFHGNAGGLQHRAYHFAHLQAEGWGIYAMSYRGFSGSTGSPTEAKNIDDALAAYDDLRAKGVAAADIVVYGESLGTGVAVQVAAHRSVRCVILESPYSSVADVASGRFWYLPVHTAIKDPYDSARHVQRVTAPILLLHGTADTVIPATYGRRLAAAVPGQKRYVEYPEGGHVNLFEFGALDEVRAWVNAPPAVRAATLN